MANHYSSLKRVRITEKRTEINKMRKTRLRHAIRRMRRAMEVKDGAQTASKLVPETYSLIDRAAKWGIIKKNTASRYKSRLAARLKAISPAAAA
jgi:small subunit ribosomal protein S20